MELFPQLVDSNKNWLDRDGIVNYYGVVFNFRKAKRHFAHLLQDIQWQNDEALIYGKKITTKRKVAWYGEKPFSYTYSKVTKRALLFTPHLLELKHKVEALTKETYNSCLLNLYHEGAEGMAWHSDAERDLKRNGAIASLSFGAERKFSLKHKQTKESVSLNLENGSLLVMKGTTQTHWLHSLPPSKKVLSPRVNLTFRTIIAP